MSSRWRQSSPRELIGWLEPVDVPWGIAGGWALDLWRGTVTREHSDIEIACFRADLPRLLPELGAFEIAIARNKVLTPYRLGDRLPEDGFSLWLRRHGETLWDFEIVTESQRDGQWVYRRDPSVTRPLGGTFVRAAEGPIIAPQIQLLYKCKEPRPKDLEDLRRYVPLLDGAQYGWLHDAVATAHLAFLAEFETMRSG
jgi:hypothetical protein